MADDLCECPKCGRMHRNLGFGPLPSASGSDLTTEIDACTPKQIADGLRTAIQAYQLKARRVSGRDRQWMRDRAALLAAAILDVSTGGATL